MPSSLPINITVRDHQNIKLGDHTHTQRMGVAADELQVLREFCTVYVDFWLRQSVGAYDEACEMLGRARAKNQIEVEVRS